MFRRKRLAVPAKHVNPLDISLLEQIHRVRWITPGDSVKPGSALGFEKTLRTVPKTGGAAPSHGKLDPGHPTTLGVKRPDRLAHEEALADEQDGDR